MRPSLVATYMDVAHVLSKRSTCARLQVGCVLTDLDGENMWVGWNGGPRGGVNACRSEEPGACGCLHAETNAVIKAPGNVRKVAYLTHSPCLLCAVALVNAHVVGVYYRELYRDSEGLTVLLDSHATVKQA